MVTKVIITCEKCTARYAIPDSAIPEKGRLVKCTKCQNQWIVKLTTSEAEQKIQQNASTSTGKEIEIIPPKIIIIKTPVALKFMPLLLIALILFTFIIFYSNQLISYFPSLANIYLKQDIYNTDNLVMQNINFHKEATDNNSNIIVSGKITNLSSEIKPIPMLSILLKDQYHHKVKTQILSQNGAKLNPNESYIISSKFTNVPNLIEYIDLNLGNKLELFFIK